MRASLTAMDDEADGPSTTVAGLLRESAHLLVAARIGIDASPTIDRATARLDSERRRS